MAEKIHLRRLGNRLVVFPIPQAIKGYLESELSYDKLILLRGIDATLARKKNLPTARTQHTNCFVYDERGRMITLYGFIKRVKRILKNCNYEFDYKDLEPHPNPDVYLPDWKALKAFKTPRHKQMLVIKKLLANHRGIINCPPGYGKSFLIKLMTKIWRKCKIHVIASDAEVIRQIYTDLVGSLPSVGLIGAGMKVGGKRVQLFCAGSLRHSDGDADVVFIDEVHQMATDKKIEQLAKYKKARIFGFTATHDKRMDKADKELEGLVGPKIVTIGYDEAQENKMVVPIEIRWTSVIMEINPCEDLHGAAKKRAGIWRNAYRNKKIAEAARLYDKNTQVLCIVDTVDHMVQLKKLLPEFTMVYDQNSMPADRRMRFIRAKLIPANEPAMTPQRRKKLKKDFSEGKLKKVIATGVWNTGVDFKSLSVLIRCDAGDSRIRDIQILGRTSRIDDKGKTKSIVHDFLDCFDRGFKNKAMNRRKAYKEQGWTEVLDDGGSKFRKQMTFGF